MVMNNYQLIGFNKLDNFDIRMSLTVIAAFGVITLVSYFNELARAGLLSRRHQPEPDFHAHSRHVRQTALIQSNKQLHKLNLDIHKIKDESHKRKNKMHPVKEVEDIKFELHLGKDKAYERSNGSKVKIYSHKNTLPNFYTTVVKHAVVTLGNSTSPAKRAHMEQLLQRGGQKYDNSTFVLLYQHEPGGHFIKDCFKHLAHSSNMSVSQSISASYRKEWEAQSKRKKNSYKYMYGGVSFGVCEDITHGCLYSIVVSHPIDRLMTTYYTCKQNSSYSFCRFPKLNLQKMSLYDFIKVQGNRLFQRLLYYNKHCRLIGNDEICLQDLKTSFVLTNAEYKAHLKNILQNIESWFAVIGLVDHLNQSLSLFDTVLHMKMHKTCSPYWQQSKLPNWYWRTRQRLLKDPKVTGWLQADLEIYDVLTQVFKKQKFYSEKLEQIRDSVIQSGHNMQHPPTWNFKKSKKGNSKNANHSAVGLQIVKKPEFKQRINDATKINVFKPQKIGKRYHNKSYNMNKFLRGKTQKYVTMKKKVFSLNTRQQRGKK